MDKEDPLVELNNHITFFAIAIRHIKNIKKLVTERKSFKVKTDKDVDHAAFITASIQRNAMVTVIFSALTLEAFINFYGINNFSKSYFNNHLDKLTPINKWIVFPQLTTGKQINTDGQSYELLRSLFKLRDKLVHYKTRKKKVSELREQIDWVTEDHAKKAIECVESLLNELKLLDSNIKIDWLRDAEKDPYA